MLSSSSIVRAALVFMLMLAWPALPRADSAVTPDAVSSDGGRYFGPLSNGKFHGQGRIEWNNGDRYEGGFVQGSFSGRGKLTFGAGEIYEGEFREGRMAGRGRMTMLDDSVYVGEFRHDYFNGNGRLDMPDGAYYEGGFENGSFHGQGHFVEPDAEYRGEFRRGRYWGEGESVHADGSRYRGSFVRGTWEGKGRYENAAGEVYAGNFVRGALIGVGSYTRPDGARYDGAFLNWRFHGRGKYTDPAGGVYQGPFVEGALQGEGTFSGSDGVVYQGGFQQWRFHGQGRLRLANGDVYQGGFEHGLYQGEGTLTYAKPRADGRTQEQGSWQFGMLPPANPNAAAANVEKALYSQRRLLDEALAAIAPNDPAKTDLYLLAVAGDGAQEVFRREVEFVRKQFAQRFGTAGRSVVLINSRNTVDSAPMATMTSVRESLAAIAARMDREKDILFVFLSSHGSQDHELVLNQNNMELRALPAAELATMLKQSGIRWKVIVVSACYSGGFIDPLKDGRTLVITAARHDRRSFGCADENDFTYFGKAFFNDALPSSGSFQEAFDKARRLVEKREADDRNAAAGPGEGDEASLPQMYSPGAVERYLRTWWNQTTR